jgi:predicted permease
MRFRFWLWLIRFVGLIVPRRLRADWRQEWEAELHYRETMLDQWHLLDWRAKANLLRRSLGAFWDALWLQPQRLEDDMFQDLHYGMRMLLRQPGFSLLAVFTLALGIGASTAIFSVVNPILFEPLPYPQSRQLTMLWDHGPDGSRQDVTFGTYREIAERSHSFEALAVMRSWQPNLTGQTEPERLDGQRVSASYFQALGIAPAQGRDFDASDDQINGAKVAILSNKLWQRRFNSDPEIIGRQIMLDDAGFTVIGVMPNGFENVLSPSAEVWTPLQYDAALPSLQSREWGHHLRLLGRLQTDVGTEQASRELDLITRAPVPEFSRPPWAALQQGVIVNSLQDEVTRGVKPALLAVLGAVLLVLAIACVNVTNLLLARSARRRGEFALRTALGAGRTRITRQLLTESLLLAIIGGGLGLIVASYGVDTLKALSPPGLPRVGAIGVDRTVFAFAFGLTTLVGVIVGLIPALHASRADLHSGLQQSSGRTVSGHQLTRRVLVVAEIALALVLLVSAGLLLRSLHRLFAISPGFDTSHLLTMQVQVSGGRFDKQTSEQYFAQVLEAVRQTSDVKAAAFTSQLPLSGDLDEYGAHFEYDDANTGYSAFRYSISPGYCEAMGIPLRRGRLLDARDTADAPPVALISESLALRKFPNQDPLGQRVQLGPANGPWYAIVGVVGDVKQASLSALESDAFYTTFEQWRFADNPLSLVIRTGGDAAALTSDIRQAIWSVDKNQPIVRVATMDTLLTATAAERRFALVLFELFGFVALALAATGIYGVLSGSVTERIREIGVRLALGASPSNILAMVVRQGMMLTAIGVVIGLTGALAATRALVTLLFGVSTLDPMTYVGVIMLFLGVAVLACWIPAWRAARVDPAITLRAE